MRMLVVGALVVFGCGKDSVAPAKDKPGGAPIDAAPAPAAVKPKPTVFFVGGKNRLVVGDADGYRRLGDDDDQFFSVVALPDGTAWISSSAGLQRYAGGALTVVDTGGLAKLSPAGVTKDGALWAISEDKVARFDGKAWTSWTHDEVAKAPGRITRLEVAPDGKAYALRGGDLAVGDGASWQAIPKPSSVRLSSLAIAGDGTVYASGGPERRTAKDKTTLLKLEGGTLNPAGTANSPMVTLITELDGSVRVGVADGRFVAGKLEKLPVAIALAIGADGTVWGRPSGGGATLVAVAPGGTKTRYPDKGAFEAEIRAVVPERGGRTWIVLESGLAVVDGGALHLLPPQTIPELPGELRTITVGADAVPLPAFPAPKRITLKGRFVDKDGKPKKGVKVEVCQGISAVYYGKTPCAGKQPTWRTTSGDDGTFTVADMPAGGWAINYSTGKDWVVRLDYTWKDVGSDRMLDDFQL